MFRKRRVSDSRQEHYERVVGEVQAVISMFRAGNFGSLNNADNVTVVAGHAAFTTPSPSQRWHPRVPVCPRPDGGSPTP